MGPSASKGKKKLLTEINMVPFIDIVLVLLIIFMDIPPFLAQSELPIHLPKAVTQKAVEDDNPVKVQVTKEGDFHIGRERVLRNDLPAKLRQLLANNPKKAVLIQADRDVSFKNVVLALDAAEQVGAAKVGVGVENPTTP